LPEDDSVYQAIHFLSEIKESPAASAEQVADAEQALSGVLGGLGAPSEAARLSRLYWWTAEYGLVGSVDDYRIYGAGILSSLWESHACHARSVRKLPLDEGCIEVGYDITQPQPQLFVVSDFEALHEVLERVADTLAFKRGGPVALAAALASQDLASVKTSSGAWLMGVLAEVAPTLVKPAWLRFRESISVSWDGELALELPILRDVARVLPVGPLADSSELVELTQSGLERFRDSVSGRHRLSFARGVSVEGRVERGHWQQGRLLALEFSDARLERPGLPELVFDRYLLVPVGEVVTVEAGAADVAYYPETDYSSARVPKPRIVSAREQALSDLYQQARRAHAQGVAGVSSSFPEVHARLTREFPEEWLLRWNLLESLLKVGVHSPLVERLQTELERLELHYARREPIASGLRYLSGSVAA
jgi:phenylalanine-4-hydroxylase